MFRKFSIVIGLLMLFLIPGATFLLAEDFSSSNFIVRDPVITIAGGQSTSTNFEFYSSSGQLAPGESSSSTFTYRAGFLYFPVSTTPILSATPGDGEVDLAWTASVGTLGNITKYEVGTSTISGGPYTYEDVGNVLSFTKSSLTNGTTYYFKLKADAGTLTLAQSAQTSATPASAGGTTGGSSSGASAGGGGGGGGGGSGFSPTGVNFSGRAYPLSKVTVLKDGQVAITTIAGPDANFTASLTGLTVGSYTFSVYGEDSKGRRSALFNFPLFITYGATTSVGGIFLAPTIDVDKEQVKRGDNITIFGQSIPDANITIATHSNQEIFKTVKSKGDGSYLYVFDSSPLDYGSHTSKSKAAIEDAITEFGQAIGFKVGDTNINRVAGTCRRADLNCDGKVNLVDFSILAFWYKKTNFPSKMDLKVDSKIDLIDFSIMAANWTG